MSFVHRAMTRVAVIGLVVCFSQAVGAASPTAGLTRTDGFIPFYWDAAHGRVLMQIGLFDQDVLYYVSAASGAGSVEMPLDRGILSTSVIHFQRAGPKVLVIEQNLKFRSVGGNEARATNVKDSFASSVLGFPENTEIETVATFAVESPGVVVRSIVPDTRFMTMRIHHSFLKAPVGYTPRAADPRIGVSSLTFQDFSKPPNERLETEWVTRWRLEKQDPTAPLSEPKKPIVFYLDPAIPEPIRSAMRDGALWWTKAFAAAGFENAVQVKDPTPDMDPMDIRYAWVLWIDRDERGFSSGGTFYDPRTGEILGSKTRMDSARVRTIASYWEVYVPGQQNGATMPAAQRDMVLHRQSLLTAHELGHALGFGHNFASSLNERASVMEYPTPRVKVTGGKLDLSEPFQPEIGAYDAFMARYAYTPLDAPRERAGLDAILAEMRAQKIIYVPSTDPRWTWYNDRATPVEYLRETMAARKIILEHYGGDILEIVPAATQRDVLGLLMQAIEPSDLYLPESLLAQLAPDPGANIEDMADDYAFDQLRAARILSALVLEPLLAPDRAERLIAFADRNAATAIP